MSFPQENYNENYVRLSRLHTIFDSNVETNLKEKAVKEILQKNGNINYQIPANRYFRAIQPDWIGYTALHLAVEKWQLEICKMLIQHGADFTIKNSRDETPLHQAMKTGYNTNDKCWNLKSKLDHPFADVILSAHLERNIPSNPRNNFGLSHFHIACMTSHAKAVEYFLKNGTSVNESIALDSPVLPGFSPLHFAARYCALEVVEILLHYGADVHIKDALGRSLINILIERNMQIVDCMNMCNCVPCSVFQMEFDTNKRIIKLLLEKHKIFSSTSVDDIGLSWQQVACTLQDMAMLESALGQSGLQNNTINSNSPMWPGYTVLHFAAHFSIDAVIFLITKGANVTIKDSSGITPLDLCLQRYKAQDIHSIIISQPNWKNIRFSDNTTNLADLVLSMNTYDALKLFLQESVPDLNIFVPLDSEFWPGCTPLHVAVMLKDRFKDNDGLYKDTNYAKEPCETKFTKDEAKLYQKRIELCTDLGADVTIKDARGSTPLHYAFYAKKADVVGLLLKKHVKIINATDNNGLSHLHIACAMGDKSLVKKFLRARCDVNSRVNSRFDFNIALLNDEREQEVYKFSISPGSTALHIAVSIGDHALSKILVKHGADLYAQDDLYGMTPIHLTIVSSYHLLLVGIVEGAAVKLLPAPSKLKECTSKYGLTHLHVACEMRDTEAVEKLLDLGANVDATIAPYDEDESAPWYYFRKVYAGAKPITLAWQASSTKIMTLLMSRGADILYKESDLSMPFCRFLHDTLENNDAIYLMLLVNQALQKRIKNETGLTMLHFACERLEYDDAQKLLSQEANPNAQAHVDSPIWPGYTPLHLLLNKGHHDYRSCNAILKLLFEHGADITLTNADGNTPLHEAFMGTYMDDYPFLTLPIEEHKNFSINPVNAHGISHFHLACYARNVEAIELFVKNGMDVQQPIDHFSEHHGGATPLHLAAYKKCRKAVSILLKAGADVRATVSGHTSLHDAATGLGVEPISKSLLTKLINAGSDVNAEDLMGTTALQLLLMADITVPKGVIELFWKPGSPVNIFNAITGEGYICIMATNNSDGLESIQQNPFYKEVIDNPERNRVDDMGRTPIHNIVSCFYARIRPVECAVLIDGFAKVGCDIDHQDNRGRTALHLACRFKNGFGIVGLLMNGIDINLLDHENNAAFSYCLPFDSLESSDDSYIMRHVENYLDKLEFFGLHINEANVQIRKCFPVLAEKNLITEKCRKELTKLKAVKIGSHAISELLCETGLVASFQNVPEPIRQKISRLFNTHSQEFIKDYPELASLIIFQYRKAIAREALIQPAYSSLNTLVGFQIPHVCREVIFGFLSNDELKNLAASIS